MDEQNYLDDTKLLGIARSEIDSSLGWTSTRLTKARKRNLDEWFGNPRGDEIAGRSQASSRITFEQVEQLLPGLIETFVGGTEIVKFVPRNPDDEASADAATKAVNYIAHQNDITSVLLTMFKDALIQRNGIVQVYWDEGDEGYLETYHGKTMEELVLLSQDPRFEFKESTPVLMMEGELVELEEDVDMQSIDPSMLRFTVRGIRRPDDGRVRIENISPEEFLINRDARGLHDPSCRFVANRTRTTVSQLIAAGVDPGVAKKLPTAGASSMNDNLASVRNSQQDVTGFDFVSRTDSERSVRVTEAYMLIDRDGDGISEWWRVLVGGDYAEVLISADAVDGHPYASVTPIPIPHRFYGLGIADVVSDINNIQTTLWRQYLDSLYLQTDPRMVVLAQGVGETALPMANLDQLLDAVPGGYVEEYAPNAIRPLQQATNAEQMIPALSLHQEMLQSRTGITPEGQGIDPNSINKTAYGVMVQQSAAAQRSTMIARIFADTGVRDIFKLIYKELLQHATTEFQIMVNGEWTPINPSDWATNLDAQISVGLGHGTRMEKMNNLQTLAAVQKELLEGGHANMVTQDKLYSTVIELCEALGFKDASRFVTDPEQNPPEPPEPDAAERAIEAQQEIEMMRVELDRQKVEVDRFKAMIDAKKIELAHEVDVAKVRLDGAKIEADGDFELGVEPPPSAPEFDTQGEVENMLADIDGAMLAAIQGGMQ